MGTNYYLHKEKCPCCGLKSEPLHIGKSSAGWVFMLHVTEAIKGLRDWMVLFESPGYTIVDEYGQDISMTEMVSTIVCRSWPDKIVLRESEKEKIEIGPSNLLRNRVDADFCIGHGEGTWDLIPREFS